MGAHEELEAANAMGLEVLDKLFAEPSEVGTRFEGRLAPGFLVRGDGRRRRRRRAYSHACKT